MFYDVNSILKKVESLFDDIIEEFIIDDKNIFEEIKVLLEEIGKKDLIKKLRKYFKGEEIFEYYNINL